ncbi:MAG: hypothetical protein EZS28_006621 [Streblomastix strix]|uniref:Uncharacterized protein n=1 Tax=Streblomastix strix TaxID=222440 RepID=A0A5J4WSE3_9EUKA|nr:MAG: hypothetical protein EZS28_006621 [Streblomastix strix]
MVRCDCSDLNWEKLQILCPVLQFAHYKGNCKHFEGNTTYFIIHANDQPAEFLLNKPTKQFTKDCEDRAIFFSKASHNCSALICGPNIYETHEFVRNQLMNNVFSQQHDVVEQMVLYSVLYNNRDSAQSAFNQVELERDKYRKVGKNFGVRFTFLDNKVLFNEIKFQFNKEQIGKDISIFNPNFNEHIILQELIGGWGNIVVRVQLNFNRIGELNGDGKITFDNKLEAELFVNSLFLEQQQVKIVQVHGTDLFLDNQRKQKQTQESNSDSKSIVGFKSTTIKD